MNYRLVGVAVVVAIIGAYYLGSTNGAKSNYDRGYKTAEKKYSQTINDNNAKIIDISLSNASLKIDNDNLRSENQRIVDAVNTYSKQQSVRTAAPVTCTSNTFYSSTYTTCR